jgi:hypothetical protein
MKDITVFAVLHRQTSSDTQFVKMTYSRAEFVILRVEEAYKSLKNSL